MNDASRMYRIVLVDPDGKEVIKKLFRIWPGEHVQAEYLGRQIGYELGKDAMADVSRAKLEGDDVG